MVFFFFKCANKTAYFKKNYEICPLQVKITFFYIVMYLHFLIKLRKTIQFYFILHLHCFTQHKINLHGFTLARSVNKFHYGIYT